MRQKGRNFLKAGAFTARPFSFVGGARAKRALKFVISVAAGPFLAWKSHVGAVFSQNFSARSARREFRHFRNRHETAYTLAFNPPCKNLAVAVKKIDIVKPTRGFGDKEEWKEVLTALQAAGKLTYEEGSDTIVLAVATPED